MSPVTVTFDIPTKIQHGLTNETLERVGGVIRNAKTKEVVMWLKETTSSFSPHLMPLLQIGSAASILNLGVSVIGFALIMRQISKLEDSLKQEMSKIGEKIDLGFHANFYTALKLAADTATVDYVESRKVMAYQAIPRFLDAQHIFYEYAIKAIQEGSPTSDKYILMLFLAYIAEVRCYLEIEEIDTAASHLKDGVAKLHLLVCKYIKMLLTSNPAAYLQAELKNQINLARLTRVYQFIDASFSESMVFKLNRDNVLRWSQDIDTWVKSLPAALIQKEKISGTWFANGKDEMPQFMTDIFGNHEDVKQAAMKKLPQAMLNMESMIETHRRFETYQTEVKAIAQLGISFHDWLQLAPQESQPESSNLMYIIPVEPLSL